LFLDSPDQGNYGARITEILERRDHRVPNLGIAVVQVAQQKQAGIWGARVPQRQRGGSTH
jgi:hypothetical protein